MGRFVNDNELLHFRQEMARYAEVKIKYGTLKIDKMSIKDFHVTSYQANFASHHTRDHHVGFLFARQAVA